jgi:hypothetical protein
MEPLALAAGTALVTAMAGDGWKGVKQGMVDLWRRAVPQSADGLPSDLDILRSEIVQAQQVQDAQLVHALEQSWQLRLHRQLLAHPAFAEDLRRTIDDDVAPHLPSAERDVISNIASGKVSGHARLGQAGGHLTVVERDQYNAGRDMTVNQPPGG